MILDSADGAPLDHDAALVIIGGGLCGLTLAHELAAFGSVIVIESGGLNADSAQAALQEGEVVGIPYPLTDTRGRGFGGSTSLWAGYCALFDAQDFGHRPWAPLSGWPFALETLAPYYQRAALRLNVTARDAALPVAPAFGFDWALASPDVIGDIWRFGRPTLRIAEQEVGVFRNRADITVLLNAAVVDFRCTDGKVSALGLRTLDGREGRVRGARFVLAAGGLETARLMLNAGIGNDWVGRCFMEHPHLTVPAFDPGDSDFSFFTARQQDAFGQPIMLCAGVSAETQARESLLNARAHIYRTPQMADTAPPRLGLFCEQQPNPECRVTLSDEIDALSLRKLRLDWRLTDLDWRSYEISAEIIGQGFKRLGLADWNVDAGLMPQAPSSVLHSNHHLGTTRMSSTPNQGVVDADGRVYGLDNLYVAGGSVLPTSSWANPTWTVTALTLRLADYLRDTA